MTDTGDSSVRCKLIYIPTEDREGWFLGILAVGIVISWIVAYCLVLALLTIVLKPTGEMPGRIYEYALLGGLVGPLGWILYYEPRQRRKAHRKQPYRDARLALVLDRAGSSLRSPHRHVESVFRKKKVRSKDVFLAIARLGAGELIVVQDSKVFERGVPVRVTRLFEPIEIVADSDFSSIEATLQDITEDQGSSSETPRTTTSVLVGTVGHVFSFVLGLFPLLFGTLFMWKLMTGSLGSRFIFLAMISFAVCGWLLTLFYERRWWLVPGGVAYREVAAWRKGMRVGLVTANDSALVLDIRAGVGYLCDGDRNYRFDFSEDDGLVIAGVWMNTACCPTLEAVRSFFGADEG
jgi:hypothetical protein